MADNCLTQVVNQVVTEPTFHQNPFHLFFTNNSTYVYNTKVIPDISADGHHAIYVESDITPKRNKQVRGTLNSTIIQIWKASTIGCFQFYIDTNLKQLSRVQKRAKYDSDILVQEHAKCDLDIPVQECAKCEFDLNIT